ncbi:hypothetical protein H312_03050 [Anncaliia algerae PRA339]|uniref:14-3-3 domain-containing protein n=1 Tax=Anncaliia algerae PRA339 TaxID=1288291 RepID=A0A059EXJ4_9MICR|nr:hypothetical protein H312_03050 [Anncaliia algerae PRA339]
MTMILLIIIGLIFSAGETYMCLNDDLKIIENELDNENLILLEKIFFIKENTDYFYRYSIKLQKRNLSKFFYSMYKQTMNAVSLLNSSCKCHDHYFLKRPFNVKYNFIKNIATEYALQFKNFDEIYDYCIKKEKELINIFSSLSNKTNISFTVVRNKIRQNYAKEIQECYEVGTGNAIPCCSQDKKNIISDPDLSVDYISITYNLAQYLINIKKCFRLIKAYKDIVAALNIHIKETLTHLYLILREPIDSCKCQKYLEVLNPHLTIILENTLKMKQVLNK